MHCWWLCSPMCLCMRGRERHVLAVCCCVQRLSEPPAWLTHTLTHIRYILMNCSLFLGIASMTHWNGAVPQTRGHTDTQHISHAWSFMPQETSVQPPPSPSFSCWPLWPLAVSFPDHPHMLLPSLAHVIHTSLTLLLHSSSFTNFHH